MNDSAKSSVGSAVVQRGRLPFVWRALWWRSAATLVLLAVFLGVPWCWGMPESAGEEAEGVARGFRFLTEKAYLPPDFDEETFAGIWRGWPEPLRSEAASASPKRRREMAFARYGLTPRPAAVAENDSPQPPLQYVVDEDGGWTMTCFSCHGGRVYGTPYPGAPNTEYALQTFAEELRATKFRLGKKLTRMEVGSMVLPLGTTVGRTNAVMFGVGLMHFRNPDLTLHDPPRPPEMVHHDMDAPPWWHFHRRRYLYIDGFAERGHRGLMQFMLIKENGPEKFHEWEADFRDVYDYLMSLRPPRYEGPIDIERARRGKVHFEKSCARCHGTYGDGSEFPGVMVPLEEIGTDPVRLRSLPVEGREKYAASWFAQGTHIEQGVTIVEPAGYVAPPLDGVWASPPYFHNGSVPTLWHVLNPDQRPTVWRRTAVEIDPRHVGFQFEQAERIPLQERDPAIRRQYFDTRQVGKSAQGHDFPLELREHERWEVLEYLKTL